MTALQLRTHVAACHLEATATGTNSRFVQACNAPGWVAAGWAQALAQFGGLLRKLCTYGLGAAVEAGRRRACMRCLQAAI